MKQHFMVLYVNVKGTLLEEFGSITKVVQLTKLKLSFLLNNKYTTFTAIINTQKLTTYPSLFIGSVISQLNIKSIKRI